MCNFTQSIFFLKMNDKINYIIQPVIVDCKICLTEGFVCSKCKSACYYKGDKSQFDAYPREQPNLTSEFKCIKTKATDAMKVCCPFCNGTGKQTVK